MSYRTINEDFPPLPFPDAEKRGVYRAIYERRDIRSYLPDPVDPLLLRKILDAAHHAPSVGFMQPWNFLLISSPDVKESIYKHFLVINEKAKEVHTGERSALYSSLKLQGILDAPHLLLITCDPTSAGQHVLGRYTIQETDVYSTCLTIQNLWLAARAEGIGIGWMSLYDPDYIKETLHIPEHIIPVALVTLGYPVNFPMSPLLESVGWRSRLLLDDVIFYETWNQKESSTQIASEEEFECYSNESKLKESLPPCQRISKAPPPYSPDDARKRINELTRPKGSLGVLDQAILKVCDIQQRVYPLTRNLRLILAAGDHGIVEEGVSAYKRELTMKMVYQFLAGAGAVNQFARDGGVKITLVDTGVDHDFGDAQGITHRKIKRGTANFLKGTAMTAEEAQRSIDNGKALLNETGDIDILMIGEMGIGNTTSASVLALLLVADDKSISEGSLDFLIGRGTGIGNQTLDKKSSIIKEACKLHQHTRDNPLAMLAAVGGFEIAFLTGVALAAGERGIPLILDGMITTVSALIACKLNPDVQRVLIAGHCSAEPSHRLLLDELHLTPILDLGMRLGEGSGAVLAANLICTACRTVSSMRTYEESNMDEPLDPDGMM